MTGNDPFDRQLARGLEHLAGPDPVVDVDDVAERAIRPRRRWRLPSVFRAAQVGVAAAVIALFAGFLVIGVLGPTEDIDGVGASPSASSGPEATDAVVLATFPPPKVTYASGTLVPIEPDGSEDDGPDVDHTAEGLDVLGYGTTRYRVSSTDARLDGIATIVHTEAYWDHETTTDDIDAEDPGGPWRLELYVARIEIRDEQGTWSGSVGPAVYASGSEPLDGSTAGSPSFDGVGPAILEGSGAYEGLSLLLRLVNHEDPDTPEAWVPDGSQPSSFEAIVVNRTLPGPPSDGVWDRLTER